MSDIMDGYRRLPPVSRGLATAIFVTSLGVYGGLVPAEWLYFHQQLIFRIPPQIWRFATSYLVTQPKLSILLDPYFVYSYASQLEIASPRFPRREDFVWYLAFASTVIILVDNLLGFQTGFYLQGLTLALAYTGTQDQRGMKANFFFLTIPAQLVPYAMMLVTFLMIGPRGLLVQLCGLLAAHLYDMLSRLWPEFAGGSNLIPTPGFVSRLAGVAPLGSSGARVEHRAFGTAIRRDPAPTTGTGTAREGGGAPLPDAWKTRGRGQRLGGD
ncbi:centromere/microtubule-binding protein cbf5 [Niveomyces insectorum RCEF 264]|uniref:Derlin n=1 Tax=Niveomyces insectorum RCEF 264 TaxID=1081102 RepID=A0A167UMI3_9HYPO|nr:centromere/microtubule-binding protein cbf5 [Niveomyces insectorum RCEF 264]